MGSMGSMGAPGTPAFDVRMLPGAFYPESINSGPDGTLYTGSLTTGEIVALPPGDDRAHVLHAAGASGIVGVTGVLVDTSTNATGLWVCAVDFNAVVHGMAAPSGVHNLSLTDGAVKAAFPMPGGSLCNDMAFDDHHVLYATDSFTGTIFRLKNGASQLDPWIVDPRFVPTPGAFGLDGICYDGAGSIIINKRDSGQIFKIAITSTGAAGAIQEIAVHPSLALPDGMRCVDHGNLLVVEGAPMIGHLTYVTVTGTVGASRVIDNRLDFPTAIGIVGSEAWVSEGQFQYLFGAPGSPSLPFMVRRVVVE